jgi:type II secretory pathway pseudopilin PulG
MRPTTRTKSHDRAGRSSPGALLRHEAGFTLLETLIAAVVLVTGLMTLFGLLDTSLKATAATRAREGATNLARQVLEDARTVPFAQMAPSAIVGELQEMHGLADASGAAGWQVVQRGITYTVAVSECSIDDPKDGYGVHTNIFNENPFCSESTTTGTTDAQPEDFKRVSVDVTWPAVGRKPDVHQVMTLTAAGEAPGLSASNLRLVPPYAGNPSEPAVIEQPVSNSLSFEVSAPSGAVAMRWSLEGVAQSTAPVFKSGTTWGFSWAIPLASVSDGTYEVSAQAIDATGVLGPPVTLPVTLVRTVPAAVKGLKGGYNKPFVSGVEQEAVELEWTANTERNVIGYRIYNQKSELVCPGSLSTLSLSLSCIDFSPLSKTSSLTYTAYALYRKYGGAIERGAPGTFTITGGPPPAPHAPEPNLVAETKPDGSVLLTWKVPASGGEPVIFYRVYRGSKDYTSRYAVAGSTSFTDTDATPEHEYWVTAVDANLTESAFLGPVKR